MRVCGFAALMAAGLAVSPVCAQNMPQTDTTLASTGRPDTIASTKDATAAVSNGAADDGAATGAPKRLSPLDGNDNLAWSHVGPPLHLKRTH